MPLAAQRDFIFKKIGYTPSPEQAKMHECPARLRLVAGGERAGKSQSAANELLSRFYEGELYWLVAADYERTRAEFNYICQGLSTLGFQYQATKQVDPGEILIAGGFRVVTKSAKDPRKLAMEAPDGVLVCEASQVDYETFLRLRGRIAEKRGWMLLSGTFESSLGWYPELFNRWLAPNEEDARSFSMPSWSNLSIYPGGRQDPEILALEQMHSKEWFMERYGGVPCPPQGLVFSEFSNAIHTGLYAADLEEPVWLWVDPGYASYYAVLAVQKRGDEIYIVDEVYEPSLVTSDIITVCQQRPWWKMVVGGAVDIAARQHQAMPSVSEIWLKEAGILLQSQKVRIQDGIEVVKTFLKVNPITNRPRLFINSTCRGLISELGGCPNPHTGQTAVYQWKTDREGHVAGEVPEDKNNHACKALAYGLVNLVGYSSARAPRKTPIKFF